MNDETRAGGASARPRYQGTGAEIVAACLEAAGVTQLFGVPGDTGVALYDALARRRDALRHVLANDERCAVFMADGYARRTNRLGVVEVSSGGGVTFAVGGLGEAFAASIPLLVLTSDISRRSRGTGALTEIDQVQLFRAVTKWQGVADAAAELPWKFAEAVAAAVTGRPAPVVLIVPEDVLDEVAEVELPTVSPAVPGVRAGADPEAVARALRLLEQAARPALLVGGGVHRSEAYEEISALAQVLGLPVATTLHGKGAIAETDPWSIGVAGGNGGLPAVNRWLEGADWVLLVGTRANATDTNGFLAPARSGPVVVQVDVEAQRAGRNYPGSIALVGDAREVLRQVLEAALPVSATALEARRGEVREVRTRAAADVAAAREAPRPAKAPGLHPSDVFRTLREASGRSSVVSDCGTPTPYLGAEWQLEEAGPQLLLARGHGPMGYALPAAIGVALAAPETPTLAIITDGSLLMAAGSLEVAARLRLPITYVHLRNGTLGWIKTLQDLYWSQRYLSTDLSHFDAVSVAQGLGVTAERVASLDELGPATRRALARGGPSFLDVEIPSEYEALPSGVEAWHRAAGGPAGRPVY